MTGNERSLEERVHELEVKIGAVYGLLAKQAAAALVPQIQAEAEAKILAQLQDGGLEGGVVSLEPNPLLPPVSSPPPPTPLKRPVKKAAPKRKR